MIGRNIALCAVLTGLPALAMAEGVAQPGDEARRSAEAASLPAPASGDAATGGFENAYEAPAIDVHGKKALKEEERFGAYKQPRWTSRRRFPTTRVYVRPKGQFAFEWWNITTVDLDEFGKASGKKYRHKYEMELGLGHRLQFDTYLVTDQKGTAPPAIHEETFEFRYALADWGELWANPTLYVEYGNGDDGPVIEGKLLLAGELAEGLHSGLNLVYEHQINDVQTNEYKVSAGISKTIEDSVFSLGAEIEVELVDVKGDRFNFDEKHYIGGPSLSWQPTHNLHLLLAPLFGQNVKGDETNLMWQNSFVVGWDT